MILLFLSLVSGFQWYPINYSPDKRFYNIIVNSNEGKAIIWRYGGNENLIKMLVHLEGGVFNGGERVLLPKNYKIKMTPLNLQLVPRAIDMRTYRRYSALYNEGELEIKWKELKRESEELLEILSLEQASLDELRELLPDRIPPPRKEMATLNRFTDETEDLRTLKKDEINLQGEEGEFEIEEEKEIKIPEEYYFSFILLEENRKERLLPVILYLSPFNELIEESIEEEKEGFIDVDIEEGER